MGEPESNLVGKQTARRFRLRFSLRGLLIAVTLFCVLFGARLHDARRQHQAVVRLISAEVRVRYDCEDYAHETPGEAIEMTSLVPGWLRWLLGNDFFHRVVEVQASLETSVQLQAICELRHLEQLEIDYDDLSPPDFAGLETLRHLRTLKVDRLRGEGSDSLLVHVVALKNLRELKIYNATDLDLEYVGRLADLRSLLIWTITSSHAGEQLKHLGNLKRLDTLDIWLPAEVTGTGLQHLRELPDLRELKVHADGLTDAGLACIAGLNQPELLEISIGRCVTDAGLSCLGKMPHLAWLSLELQDSPVTDEGL